MHRFSGLSRKNLTVCELYSQYVCKFHILCGILRVCGDVMSNKQSGVTDEVIHNKQFEEEFLHKQITPKTMICDYSRLKESLDGAWSFAVDQYNSALRAKWYLEQYKDSLNRNLPVDYNFDQWEKISVPACWNLMKERYFYYEGTGIYTRTFTYVKKEHDERLFLKIGAANYDTKVFLNSEYLGFHKGGSTPFFIELTEQVQAQNRILILVDNTRKQEHVPSVNKDWFNYGGIYRSVELIRLPHIYIKTLRIHIGPCENSQSKMGKTCEAYTKIQVTLQLNKVCDGTALCEIPELGVRISVPVTHGVGEVLIDAIPELWTPENPKLYEVHVSYMNDRITERVGFRFIEVKGRDIYLNGKPIRLKGVCCHEDSENHGKAVTDKEIRETIGIAKEMGCNYIRLAHYPHTERFAQIADEMGMMLWEELPVYWAISFENKGTQEDAQNQLTEMIQRDINRASVIIWSVGNENDDTDDRLKFMSDLVKKAKSLDATRLVSAACLINHVELVIQDRLMQYLDIVGINEYFGWYDPDLSKLSKLLEQSNPQQPVVITEFGGGAKFGQRGTVHDLFSEDAQEEIYKKQVEAIKNIPYIQGTSPWILFDFRCPRRMNQFQNYYNRKGLVTADKKHKKRAFFVMKDFYETY